MIDIAKLREGLAERVEKAHERLAMYDDLRRDELYFPWDKMNEDSARATVLLPQLLDELEQSRAQAEAHDSDARVIEALHKRCSELCAELERSRAQAETQADRFHKRAERVDAVRKLKNTQFANDVLRHENTELRAKCDELREENANLNETVDEWRNLFTTIRIDRDELRERCNALAKENEALRAENMEQESRLLDPDATCCADASRVHKEQRLRIETLEVERTHLMIEFRNLQASNEALRVEADKRYPAPVVRGLEMLSESGIKSGHVDIEAARAWIRSIAGLRRLLGYA